MTSKDAKFIGQRRWGSEDMTLLIWQVTTRSKVQIVKSYKIL